MKAGFRTPNLKKSVKARTTGKVKRTVKKSVNPLYGKRGMGYVNDPKKAVYNKVYNKTTIDAIPRTVDGSIDKEDSKKEETTIHESVAVEGKQEEKTEGVIFLLLSIVFYILFIVFTIYIVKAMIRYPLARKTPFNYITMIALLAIATVFKKIYKGFNNK